MSDLLKGKSVVFPKYVFELASKKYDGEPVTLDSDEILIIEGLHCLNEEVSKNIDKKNKYKVYVSPFTPLTLDRHNYISTTDNRLLRRLVRDNRTRGVNPERTLATWADVREGEEKYIFPFTDEADVILKVYAEPLLYSVKVGSTYYQAARRLLDSLKVFFPISSEYLASDNVLREFIGKSEFNEG